MNVHMQLADEEDNSHRVRLTIDKETNDFLEGLTGYSRVRKGMLMSEVFALGLKTFLQQREEMKKNKKKKTA